jgi:hypothetical protein
MDNFFRDRAHDLVFPDKILHSRKVIQPPKQLILGLALLKASWLGLVLL